MHIPRPTRLVSRSLATALLAVATLSGAVIAATPASAAPVTDCVKQPPAAVPWGDDQVRFCYTASGGLYVNPLPAGSDAMPRHAPWKNSFVVNPTAMPRIIGQVYGKNATTGAAMKRNMVSRYNVNPPAGFPGVDPAAKVNTATYSTTGMKVQGGWLIESPMTYTPNARTVAFWIRAGNRTWIQGPRADLYGRSVAPVLSSSRTASGFCSVKVHMILNWGTYTTATAQVRFVNRSGKQQILTLNRTNGGSNADLTVGVPCQTTEAKAMAKVLATRIQWV